MGSASSSSPLQRKVSYQQTGALSAEMPAPALGSLPGAGAWHGCSRSQTLRTKEGQAQAGFPGEPTREGPQRRCHCPAGMPTADLPPLHGRLLSPQATAHGTDVIPALWSHPAEGRGCWDRTCWDRTFLGPEASAHFLGQLPLLRVKPCVECKSLTPTPAPAPTASSVAPNQPAPTFAQPSTCPHPSQPSTPAQPSTPLTAQPSTCPPTPLSPAPPAQPSTPLTAQPSTPPAQPSTLLTAQPSSPPQPPPQPSTPTPCLPAGAAGSRGL